MVTGTRGREGSRSPARAAVFPAAILFFTAALAILLIGPPAEGAAPSGVFIASLSAEPEILHVPYGSESGRATLNLTLQNPQEGTLNVTVTVTEGGRSMETRAVSVPGNSSLTLRINWSVKGTGVHRAEAALGGGNESPPSHMAATCELTSGRPVMNPSPWYTIPCAFLFIIVPSVAIWLLIRRARGGDWLERWAKR